MDDTLDPPHAGNLTPFRFLDLPPELRNRIYELAFTSKWRIAHYFKNPLPSILRVSQQLRKEAIGIWLADTTFTFDNRFHFMTFLINLGRSLAKQITSARLECRIIHGGPPTMSLDFAQSCARECEAQFDRLGLQEGALHLFVGSEGPIEVTWPSSREEWIMKWNEDSPW